MRWRRWTGSLQQGSLAEGPGGLRAATEQVLSAQALTEANLLLSKAGQYFILFSACFPRMEGEVRNGNSWKEFHADILKLRVFNFIWRDWGPMNTKW